MRTSSHSIDRVPKVTLEWLDEVECSFHRQSCVLQLSIMSEFEDEACVSVNLVWIVCVGEVGVVGKKNELVIAVVVIDRRFDLSVDHIDVVLK